jgi:hypothetical protein
MATSHLASQCTHSGGGICMVQVPDQGIEEETRSVTALLERLRRVFEGSRVRLLGSIDALLIARNLVSKPSWACAIYVTIISRSWMCQCGLCEDLKGRSSTVGYRQLGIVHGYRARAEAQGPAKLGQGQATTHRVLSHQTQTQTSWSTIAYQFRSCMISRNVISAH